MIKTGVFTKILEFYERLENPNQISYFNSVLKKAMNFPECIENQDRNEFRMSLKRYMDKGLIPKEGKKYSEAK